jgi:hypothetical protein
LQTKRHHFEPTSEVSAITGEVDSRLFLSILNTLPVRVLGNQSWRVDRNSSTYSTYSRQQGNLYLEDCSKHVRYLPTKLRDAEFEISSVHTDIRCRDNLCELSHGQLSYQLERDSVRRSSTWGAICLSADKSGSGAVVRLGPCGGSRGEHANMPGIRDCIHVIGDGYW